MSARPCYALQRGGIIYTLRENRAHNRKPFRWVGFMDGERCGFFKSKGDFERFVGEQPDEPRNPGPHAEAAYRAQSWSTYEGLQILAALNRNH